jgi:hypothetical protein
VGLSLILRESDKIAEQLRVTESLDNNIMRIDS